MGLFINNDNHPDVYKNKDNITADNQEFVRHNSLTDLINKQQKTNMELIKSIGDIKPRYKQLEETQTFQWNQVKNQMDQLNVGSLRREEVERKMMERLHTLDERTIINLNAISENEGLLKSVIEQINILSESNQKISSRIKKNETANQKLSLQMKEQLELQKDVADKLSHQEEYQAVVLKRLDNQEALTEKISRQLNHIRSILFERTNYIATKLEEGYGLTSSYIYKLMTGSDQPLTFSMLSTKKEEVKEVTTEQSPTKSSF